MIVFGFTAEANPQFRHAGHSNTSSDKAI